MLIVALPLPSNRRLSPTHCAVHLLENPQQDPTGIDERQLRPSLHAFHLALIRLQTYRISALISVLETVRASHLNTRHPLQDLASIF